MAPYSTVIENLTPNPGTDLLRYARTKDGVLSLAQGEGSTPTPDFICDAAMKALKDKGMTFYGPILGHPELREELSTYYKNIYGLDIPSNRFFVTSSGTTAVHLSLAAIINNGDEVIAITPIWKNLLSAVEIAQAKIKQVAVDFSEDKGWSLDLNRLFDACTPATKAIMIVTPSNPTGWTMSRSEMQAVMEFARKRGIWVLADEVYTRTLYGQVRAPSFLDVCEPDDLLLVINSFSKTWAMTGWRLGWIVGPPSAEMKICDLAVYNNMGPPSFTQYGALAALRQGEGFISEQMTLWQSNCDLLMDRMAQFPRMSISRPEAGFYAFFKVEGEEDSIAYCKRLIDEVGLSLAPGCAFGDCGRGFVRLAFACSETKLLDGLDRLERMVT
ncbi:MAG: pyridoxal phosphate-dependent aminotransferase [Alphaproteobacteria bacterium]|nr:pyridoxal phosphate-dependent aminotransferase [Alphaproteobacteria bacterium]MCB9975252.1 pyridoxal phosphate-dependent aminotransferase [Rhodospirillales bacterium]